MTRTLREGLLLSLNGFAKNAAKLAVNVVFPTPPFRFATVRMSLLVFCSVSMVLGGCGLCLIASHNPGPCSCTALRMRLICRWLAQSDGRPALAEARPLASRLSA